MIQIHKNNDLNILKSSLTVPFICNRHNKNIFLKQSKGWIMP